MSAARGTELWLKVHWLSAEGNDPVMLYHEVGADGWETRRIELFDDGRLQRADEIDEEAPTSLAWVIFPSLEEISRQREFALVEIDRAQFEEVWERAGRTREEDR